MVYALLLSSPQTCPTVVARDSMDISPERCSSPCAPAMELCSGRQRQDLQPHQRAPPRRRIPNPL
jgi:hypothetical protein